MRFFDLTAVALIAAASAAMPVSAATNLLINGGFDDDAVPAGGFIQYSTGDTIGGGGWTVLGAPGSNNAGLNLHTNYTESGVAFPAHAGPNALDLTAAGNTGPLDGVEQNVTTSLGQTYFLSFYVGNATGDGTGNSGSYVLPSTVNVSFGGTSLGSFTNSNISLGTINWQLFTTSFVGNGVSTALSFTNGTPSGDNYAGLDSVSLVAAVPEPATWAMMLIGFGGVGAVIRRRRAATTTALA